jgi:hypothetical protein
MPISSYLRPRYSLRALLVVTTLLALVLLYHLDWIQQRRTILESGAVSASESHDSLPRPAAPGLLWMFGEQGYQTIFINGDSNHEEAERLYALFPEGQVSWMTGSQAYLLP